jgi:hypothetical protein
MNSSRFNKKLCVIGYFECESAAQIKDFAERQQYPYVAATTASWQGDEEKALLKAGFTPITWGDRCNGNGYCQLWLFENKNPKPEVPKHPWEIGGINVTRDTHCCGIRLVRGTHVFRHVGTHARIPRRFVPGRGGWSVLGKRGMHP